MGPRREIRPAWDHPDDSEPYANGGGTRLVSTGAGGGRALNPMVSVLDVECPVCGDMTVVLAPDGSSVIDRSLEMDDSIAADAVVRTTCDDDDEFVVYLREN